MKPSKAPACGATAMAGHDVSHLPVTLNRPGQHPNVSKSRRPATATPMRENERRTPVSGSSSRFPIVAREHHRHQNRREQEEQDPNHHEDEEERREHTEGGLDEPRHEASCASKGCGSAPGGRGGPNAHPQFACGCSSRARQPDGDGGTGSRARWRRGTGRPRGSTTSEGQIRTCAFETRTFTRGTHQRKLSVGGLRRRRFTGQNQKTRDE